MSSLKALDERLKRAVIAGGGQWVGIQEVIPPSPSLVLFNSPTTGTTLAVPAPIGDDFSDTALGEAIRNRIANSDAEFKLKKVKVRAEDIRKAVWQLRECATSLEELIERN